MTSRNLITLIILALLLSACTLHVGVSFDSDTEKLDEAALNKVIEEN